MYCPFGVRISLLKNVVSGRVSVCGGKGVGVEGGGGVTTAVSCDAPVWAGSYTSSVFAPPVVPTVLISAVPSIPTSTPCGAAGTEKTEATDLPFRSITLTLVLPPFVTYSHALSGDIAAASGPAPTA